MSKSSKYKTYDGSYDFVPTNAGKRMQTQFVRVNDVTGEGWHLEKSGEYDIQEAINSACPQSTSELLNRYLRGDVNALKGDDGQYADVSEIGDLGTVYKRASILKYVDLIPDEKGKIDVKETENNAESE